MRFIHDQVPERFRCAVDQRGGFVEQRQIAARPTLLRRARCAKQQHDFFVEQCVARGFAPWYRALLVPNAAYRHFADRDALLNAVTLFGMGFSWGGFESLIIPFDCEGYRTATRWSPGGPTLRLHIGLENVDDLKADLDRGFAALKAAQ